MLLFVLMIILLLTPVLLPAWAGRLSGLYVCVYVSTLKQKPLNISPNLADG